MYGRYALVTRKGRLPFVGLALWLASLLGRWAACLLVSSCCCFYGPPGDWAVVAGRMARCCCNGAEYCPVERSDVPGAGSFVAPGVDDDAQASVPPWKLGLVATHLGRHKRRSRRRIWPGG